MQTQTQTKQAPELNEAPTGGDVQVFNDKVVSECNKRGISVEQWNVLRKVVYPAAKSDDIVFLAWDYCKSRGLDVMKKAVNVVPMWNSKSGKEEDTIWPSIVEVRTTAARTNKYAGKDKPVYGDNVIETFYGKNNESIQLTYPEWCEVKVWRIVDGVARAFSEVVYWKEIYGKKGGTPIPNSMWQKRPRGQLAKCAEAASLRCAFPEELGAMYTDDEAFIHDAVVVEAPKKQKQKTAEDIGSELKTENYRILASEIIEQLKAAKNKEAKQTILDHHKDSINKMVMDDSATAIVNQIYEVAGYDGIAQ